jgi:hypothetical protein
VNSEHLDFLYYGLYAVLRRYRAMTILGWGISAAGVAGFIASWSIPGAFGLHSAVLAALVVLAGLALVQVSVMALQSYVSIRFPPLPAGSTETDLALRETLDQVTAGVRDGGWEDAFQAIRELRAIGERMDLPPPDHAQSPYATTQQQR